MTKDNRDLAHRRQRLGLNQPHIANFFGFSFPELSKFETGKRKHDDLPGNRTRADYEALLDKLEAMSDAQLAAWAKKYGAK